uniref:DNA polymerase kappa n=1 Tax=Kwoniella dejecticola CBS 10117 TaxID=1296121 RepID=A0A1A6A4H2_9TREE|nr:DNA polymerase kappa subunit [Kwoniella dejecticola CBS 10117]OBR84960.1 DNA polymerase kappa subunit [Kwoniella dejecticola CBS 10117]
MPSPLSKDKGKAEIQDDSDLTEEEKAALAAAAEARQRSFERSFAGPSVGKAGLVRDQTEINKVIAEASKGSKYYQNQVRKDKELTEKIEWYQAKRDELMKMANIPRLEAEADRILLEVEATRDISQTIVHVDMDAFYASVEVQRDPTLKGKAFGVGQGVLTTASYEARKFGCRSGMAGFIAKKLCPHIILTKMHFDLYIAASKAVREVLLQYDENLMMASLDEGYLNITPYMSTHNMSASDTVAQIRAEVEAKTQLTMSAGIAPNRMLAKICSDKNKPNGQYEMEFERSVITKFMRDLPVRKIPGFGRVTERCLEGLGVETCGDIYTHRAELLVMDHWFGFRGLCKAYLGIADNNVAPGKREERRSVGVERTFRDKVDEEDILNEVASIAEELEKDLERLQYAGKTVTVKYKLHTFENKTRAKSVGKYISTSKEILPIALELMKRELPVRIRLLGIRLSTLKDLTIVDKGIKGFLVSPSKKRAAGGSRTGTPVPTENDDDSPELIRMEEEDEAEVLDMTLDDDQDGSPAPNETLTPPPTSALGKRKSSENDKSHLLGPVCPICSKALGAGTSNIGLNEHIDWCLNKDAISEASKKSPVKKARLENGVQAKKAKEKGTMLDWLKKK